MANNHVAVWIDHREARVFHIDAAPLRIDKLLAPHPHLTRKAEDHGHYSGDERFFHKVAGSLRDADRILVVGPHAATLEFIRYVHRREQMLTTRIAGVETLDHPTEPQLIAYIRNYFSPLSRAASHGSDETTAAKVNP